MSDTFCRHIPPLDVEDQRSHCDRCSTHTMKITNALLEAAAIQRDRIIELEKKLEKRDA